ncbi:MAG: hypothetical protein Q9207_003789 [Kuettlingeria erythrocarpa]
MFKRHEEPCTPTTKNPYDFKKPYGPCPPVQQPVRQTQDRDQLTANIFSRGRPFDPADPHVTAWDIQNQQQPATAVSGPAVSMKIPPDLVELHSARPSPTKVPVQQKPTVSPAMDHPCGQDVQDFGAMQIKEDMTDWGAWYIVENDGEISNMPGWNHPGGREVSHPTTCFTKLIFSKSLWAAGRSGLAAGKLWIDGTQAVNPNSQPFVCSGFCLGRRWFFTSRYFLQSLDWPTDAIAYNGAMDKMKDPKQARVFIGVGRKSTTMLRDSDPKLRDAYLVTATDDLDIAIFQLKDHEPDWEHSVRLDQLAPARLDSPQAIFSIGYSGDCSTAEQQEEYKKYLDAFPDKLKGPENGKALQKFNELRIKPSVTRPLRCPHKVIYTFSTRSRDGSGSVAV